MLLAVVIGNSFTNFCLMEDDQPRTCFSLPTDPHRSADKYSTFLIKKFNDVGARYDNINDMIVSSVVPKLNTVMREFGHRFLNLSPVIVGEDTIDWGFKIDIPNPKEAPTDVLVDVVAVNSLYGAPALIINFGTITTFVVTNKEGNPCGAIIAPGCKLTVKGFCDYYGFSQEIPLTYPDKVVGQTTAGALQSGVVLGHMAMVSVLIQKVLAEQGQNMLVIGTGGCMDHFKPHIPEITHWDLLLTMYGLHQIYEQNKYILEKYNTHLNLKRM